MNLQNLLDLRDNKKQNPLSTRGFFICDYFLKLISAKIGKWSDG
ncbi:hypothetical protein SAMN05444409_0015 [Epilithonimonas zeae]|uniref:Uncharacterized protein n=1 Tax=Epilithonimonas zeae TaxID=1416779 RepID=A0A1N6DSL6_9FLAO|nr:hypothetical protein SAMN05444409_0015 [Epilithonimonas zeae]